MASHAVTLFGTSSLTGNVSLNGFSDGDPKTFTASFSQLQGTVNMVAVGSGSYTLSLQGSGTFTGCADPACRFDVTVPTATPLFTGSLVFGGLTPGPYSFVFGTELPAPIAFGFTVDYDGQASSQLMARLQALGFPFVDPRGAGRLVVAGTFGADGSSATLSITESNLSWTGFGGMLAMADAARGGGNGVIDGAFALSNVAVTAVPEPASQALWLLGLPLLGWAAARRRLGR